MEGLTVDPATVIAPGRIAKFFSVESVYVKKALALLLLLLL